MGNVLQAVGILGAVIMPHNLFLHSALVQTRSLKRTNKAAVREGNYYFTIEGGMSLLVSFFINLFIVAVFAKGFGEDNQTGVVAKDVGLRTAGDFLGARFGSASRIIWGVGLLAAGQASTMTGTFSGQYVMAGFLEIQWAPWKRTMLTRAISLGPSLLIAIAAERQLDSLNEWLNVQQSVQLPFALLPLMFFNCNPRVMGEFALGKKWECFFWIASFAVIGINVYLTVSFIDGLDSLWQSNRNGLIMGILVPYLGFCAWLMLDFCRQRKRKFEEKDMKKSLNRHRNNNKENEDSLTGVPSIEPDT